MNVVKWLGTKLEMKRGYVRPSPRCPREEQIIVLTAWGAKSIYIEGEGEDRSDFIRSLRPDDEPGVSDAHRFGFTWTDMLNGIETVEAKGLQLINARKGKPLSGGDIAAAKAYYAGEKRIPTTEDARARAKLSHKARGKMLNGNKRKVERLWRDHEIETDKHAMARIAGVLGDTVSYSTLYREFGPSGRPRGNR